MRTKDLFYKLIKYHYEVNLQKSIDSISKGVVLNRDGKPYEQGKDNNENTKGFLVICNGPTLVDKLHQDDMFQKDRIVLDDYIFDFTNISDYNKLKEYMIGQGDADGAYIFDSSRSAITRVGDLQNDPPNLNMKLQDLLDKSLPKDFVSYDESIPVNFLEIGTKTKVALKLTRAYPYVEAFQIKRSAYGHLGLGKVTHFTKDGLAEEFFFEYNPDPCGKYFDEENKIIGKYRRYKPKDGKAELVETKIINPDILNQY